MAFSTPMTLGLLGLALPTALMMGLGPAMIFVGKSNAVVCTRIQDSYNDLVKDNSRDAATILAVVQNSVCPGSTGTNNLALYQAGIAVLIIACLLFLVIVGLVWRTQRRAQLQSQEATGTAYGAYPITQV